MTYEDAGFDQYFDRSLRTQQLPIEVIPDFTGVNLDRILESIPIERILPTGSLYSANKKVELNLKDGYLEFLDDKNSQAIRFGQQPDGTFGFFIRKHTGEQIIDEEGIKDVSIALRTDIQKLASKPEKETAISSLPFFTNRISKIPQLELRNADYWREIPESQMTFKISGSGIIILMSAISGWAGTKQLFAINSLDGKRVGTAGYIQQVQRETITLVACEEITSGEHTVGFQTLVSSSGDKFQLEQFQITYAVFGKKVSVT